MYKKRISNPLLNRISFLLRKTIDLDSTIVKFKIYETDNTIILQAKHAGTKQSIRFCIFLTPVNNIRVVLFLRDRNPNTVEYFDKLHTVKDTIECVFDNEIDGAILQACDFLLTESEFIKIPFTKIKTCNKVKDLTDSNVLVRIVEGINVNSDKTKVTFVNTDNTFTFDTTLLYSNVRKPSAGDFFFIDNKERFQTYNPLRAKHHFEL